MADIVGTDIALMFMPAEWLGYRFRIKHPGYININQ